MKVQMPAIMKRHARMAQPGIVDFAGNVVLGMPRGHEHAGQHHDGLGPALDAVLDGLLNDGPGELQKAAFDDPPRLIPAKHLDQRAELLRPFRVAAAVADQ